MPDDLVDVSAETIRQQLHQRESAQKSANAEQWPRELHAWIQGHFEEYAAALRRGNQP